MKPALIALLTATLLATGCQQAGAPALTGASADGAYGAASLSSADEAAIAGISEEIAARFFADETADPRWKGAKEGLNGPRGGILYRMLNGSKALRAVGYKVSQGPVQKHFSKPGQQDEVPALTRGERQELMGLLQPGDIIQCGNNASFVHAIFYLGDDRIVHALAQAGLGKKMIGVIEEKLSDYLDRVDRDKVVVLRPKWTPEKLKEATAYARAQAGKDYDTLFMTDTDERFYCTELIYHILTKTGVARVTPHLEGKVKWRLITNEDIRKSPDLEVIYRRNHD